MLTTEQVVTPRIKSRDDTGEKMPKSEMWLPLCAATIYKFNKQGIIFLILFCSVCFACTLEAGDSGGIARNHELNWAVTTFVAFLPFTVFLFYVLFAMLRKISFFHRSSILISGEIVDFSVESVALGGGTWHPTIEYYTAEGEKVVFIPDSTLMFKPGKGKKISIRILKDDCKVAELFKLRSGFFVCLAIACAATIVLSRTFMYAVTS